MNFVKLVRCNEKNYMHTSEAWLNDVVKLGLGDNFIIDILNEETEDMNIQKLDVRELEVTDENTTTWMGEYGGYRFYSCGGEVIVFRNKTDNTYWCTEEASQHFFTF